MEPKTEPVIYVSMRERKVAANSPPFGFRLLVRIAFPELELAIRVSKPIYIDIADLAPRLYALK